MRVLTKIIDVLATTISERKKVQVGELDFTSGKVKW